MALNVEPLVFDVPPSKDGRPSLKLCAKRYTTAQSANATEGLTLLFTHCISSHKEVWEPVIERLFQLQQHKHSSRRIREAYSFDWQTHGAAGILNEEVLKLRPEGVTGYEWAAAIAAFVKAHQLEKRNTVAIGHSVGAGILMCSTVDFPSGSVPYASFILVEPTIVSEQIYNDNIDAHQFVDEMVISNTLKRRDVWDDRETAIQWLSKRSPWKFWDPRALQLYSLHGLRLVGDGPSVTLNCVKAQEARAWAHNEPHPEPGKPPRSTPKDAAELFKSICKKSPIHVIWGSRNNFNPVYIQEALTDASQGRVAASVTKVEGAGHFVVQEKPDALAEKLADALDHGGQAGFSKL
ncbi:alpha/beta-hydrolase [Athelia psychrophila]|uniref:Alpha/beta-hydrolase n=1 Tax=Athelia psychrophila TaxID=1759441 RepID=A0A166W9Y7_9AGAM|nr:alpha/beta-hydrolase [Fibularhizoctonia sp. CBS 109695]